MKLDLEEFIELSTRLAEIESVELKDLHVYLDGIEVDKDLASPISVEDFEFTGLINRHFLEILVNEVLIS